jgi:hypothetical protein
MGITREFCKHQIVIILMVVDVIQEDVIDYCGITLKSKPNPKLKTKKLQLNFKD